MSILSLSLYPRSRPAAFNPELRRYRRSNSDEVDIRISRLRSDRVIHFDVSQPHIHPTDEEKKQRRMEELQKLEKVQRMMSFMEDRGLSTRHHDSDRFLAHLILLLVQPSGLLDMQKKCNLISELMQTISSTVLEDALFYVTEDQQQLDTDVPSSINNLDNRLNCHFDDVRKYEDMAKVDLDCMQSANSTLEDFCRSYFMFHGMDVNNPESIFKFLPVLSFTESYIYQLDTMSEKSIQSSLEESISPECDANHFSRATHIGRLQSFHFTPRPECFDPLIRLLHCQGLLTERIRTELQSGVEYWELERKLCHALTCKKKILFEEVMRAVHLKSFDYRVLNLLLYQLRNQQVNELHMEFLSISEFLVEVSDDLYDYEDDVLENSFNILRMFVGVYGASRAPVMLAKHITEAEEKYKSLSQTLDPDLSLKYWRRCEEATKEGGATSGHAFGTWSIPPVIADEELFRLQTKTR